MRKARLARDLSELELDDLDLSILAELLEDGRRTVRAIARAYDVSDGTIRYRLRNLRSQGLLNTTMAVDPATAGLHTWAFLEIAVRPSGMGDLVSQLQCKEWLEGLSLKTGDRALFCTMLTGSARELNSVVAWIRTHPAVRDVSSYLTTDIHVMDRRWCLPIGSV
ncbi:MAG: AsnC family transcriptional regulator [Gemmatimonadota bacterium]|nr:AsnC family transcriptional regulator [Gemmatimonadota bacterium]